VGPAIAGRIIEYRESYGHFSTAEELMQVKGIGPSTFEQIKDLIVVR
jgi:competence protein ComEA